MIRLRLLAPFVFALCPLAAGCWMSAPIRGDGTPDADTDTDTDTDTGTETETESESATEPAPDPLYQWHTFYGSSAAEAAATSVVDASGNVIVAGTSLSSWDGPGGEEPLTPFAGGECFFVLKLDTAGNYLWHAFYGPALAWDNNRNYSVAVNGAGDIHVATRSSAPWSGPDGESPLRAHTGEDDIVILKLEADGEYAWHTFCDSDTANYGPAIAIDAAGDLVVAGASRTEETFDHAPLVGFEGPYGVFVLKLDADGAYQWHTFPGRCINLSHVALAIVGGDRILVTGRADAAWDGPDGQSPLRAYTPEEGDVSVGDVFVTELGADGGYLWHTFHGSASGDGGFSVAAGEGGELYVAGLSDGGWNGPSGQSPLRPYTEGDAGSPTGDAVVLALGADGEYLWHTFFGSSESDGAFSLVPDGEGRLVVGGVSREAWDGPGGESPLDPYAGGSEVFLLALGVNGVYQWHAFYGAAASDGDPALALDGSGGLYAAGRSNATWDGPAGESPLHEHAGLGDAFVMKLAY